MTQYSLFDILPKEDNQLAPIISKGRGKDAQFRGAIINGVSYFSIIDVINHLMGYENKTKAKNYWMDLKIKIAKDEPHFQLAEISHQLKLLSSDGKRYKTECFCLQDILRIIISTPSPKVEHIKRRLSQIAEERLLEELNPDLIMDRAIEGYRKVNSEAGWAEERARGRVARNEATRVYVEHGVKGEDIGLLTSDTHKGMTGMSVKQHKQVLGIKDTPRNHMTETELAATRLAELLGIDEIKAKDAQGTWACRKICLDAGKQVSPIWDSIQNSKRLTDKN